MNNSDLGIETLLELDGEMFPMDNGYWVKFEVKKVEPNIHIPHGIKYSITLHDSNNHRVLGYDNAHGIKPKNNFLFKFRTEGFKIDTLREYNILTEGLFELFFNSMIDLDTLKNHLSIVSPKYDSLTLSFADTTNTGVLIKSDSIPALGEQIIVEIDSLFPDLNGKTIGLPFNDTIDILTVRY